MQTGGGRALGRWACTREPGVHWRAGRAHGSRVCTGEPGVHAGGGRARGRRACTGEPGMHTGAGRARGSQACTRESGVHTRAGHAHGSRACTREPGVHWRAGCARRSRACKGGAGVHARARRAPELRARNSVSCSERSRAALAAARPLCAPGFLGCGEAGLAPGPIVRARARQARGGPPAAGPSLPRCQASEAVLLCISKCSKSHFNGKFTERFSASLCWCELSLIQ